MSEFLFIAGAALAIVGGLLAVVARNLFHASLGLAMTLTGTAGLSISLAGESSPWFKFWSILVQRRFRSSLS